MAVKALTEKGRDIVMTRLRFDLDKEKTVRNSKKNPTIYYLANNEESKWNWVTKSSNSWAIAHFRSHKEANNCDSSNQKRLLVKGSCLEWGPVDSAEMTFNYVVIGEKNKKKYFLTWRNGPLANYKPFVECDQVKGLNWTTDLNEATVWQGDQLIYIRWIIEAYKACNVSSVYFRIQLWKGAQQPIYIDVFDKFIPDVTKETTSLSPKRERSFVAEDQKLLSFEKRRRVDVSDWDGYNLNRLDRISPELPPVEIPPSPPPPPPALTCTQYETDYPCEDLDAFSLSDSLIAYFRSLPPPPELQCEPK